MVCIYLKKEYGIFERYNYFSAKSDIKENNIQLVTFGLIGEDWTVMRKVAKKFGFNYISSGCSINGNGFTHYNSVMTDYLNNKNGQKWKSRFDKMTNNAIIKFDSATRNRPFIPELWDAIADSVVEKIFEK